MKGEVIFAGVASAISAIIEGFTDLGLSFTALSPLMIGGIVGSVAPALATTLLAGYLLYQFYKEDPIEEDNKDFFASLSIITLASAAIGVGLAAAAIFPGAMLGMGPAFLISAVIAGIALITTALAMEYIIMPIAEKVNEHVISPVIEKISECFSSKGLN